MEFFPTSDPDLSIQIYDSFSSIETLWRQFETTALCTTYQRFDYLETWQRHCGTVIGIQPFLVVAFQDNRPVMLLPLGIIKIGPFLVARFLGGKHTNFNLGIYAPDFIGSLSYEKLQYIFDAIRKTNPQISALELLKQPSEWLGYKNPFLLLPHSPSPSNGYAMQLKPDFDALIREKRGSKTVKKMRWQDRNMEKHGGYHCGVTQSIDGMHKLYNVFERQKALRFERMGIPNIFDDINVRAFYHELIARSENSNAPLIEFAFLSVNNIHRALYAGGVWQGRYSAYFNSISEDELTRFSPGELLLNHLIRGSCKRQLTLFDLGTGEAAYKTSWCDIIEYLFDSFIPLNAMGSLYATSATAKQFAKRKIKENNKLFYHAKRLRANFKI